MKAHRKQAEAKFLNGVFRRLRFSRSGHVSGVELRIDGATVYVTMQPHDGAAILSLVELGKRLPVLAVRSEGSGAAGKSGLCYAFKSLATPQGRPRAWPPR